MSHGQVTANLEEPADDSPEHASVTEPDFASMAREPCSVRMHHGVVAGRQRF
jgi:hypothetical protein